MGLAQVEFVAGGAVVHSNRCHGLGAISVKVARKHDTSCLRHSESLQRGTANGPLARNPAVTIDRIPAAVDQRAASGTRLAGSVSSVENDVSMSLASTVTVELCRATATDDASDSFGLRQRRPAPANSHERLALTPANLRAGAGAAKGTERHEWW